MSTSEGNPGTGQNYLAPVLAYYIRKLLRQNLDRLRFVVASGAGLKADPVANLNTVIESLYIDEAEIKSTTKELERLASYHQVLSSQGARYRKELAAVEEQIFWLLGFKQADAVEKNKILIIDDTPANLQLLSAALTREGYEVSSAINGAMGIAASQTTPPDLILLDILMPGMDGYETCKRLKAAEKTRDVPVVFVSAIDEVMDKVKAFEVGGIDYIPKPFQIEEVLARVENQLKIRNLQKRLEEQNVRFQQELCERNVALDLLKVTQLSLDKLEHCVLLTRLDGHFFYVNEAACSVLGYPQEELLPMSMAQIDRDFTLIAWGEHWKNLKQCGMLRLPALYRSRSGQTIAVEGIHHFIEFNNQEYDCIIARPI